MRAIFVTSLLLVAVMLSGVSSVLADELQEFEQGRRAYKSQNYTEAKRRFFGLVGGETPRVQSRPLILESRKYLGASYLFLGESQKAEEQFTKLLRMDTGYSLDPLAFPSEVIRAFESARAKVERVLEQAAAERAEAEARERKTASIELMKRQKRRERLRELAETEKVERVNSRWVAAVPFGVGQFQKGDDALGVVFLLSEGVLAATSITTYFLHESLRNEVPAAQERQRALDLRDGFRAANWISTGLLALVATVGVIDAQLRFVPVVEEERKRELPEDLQEELQLSLHPTGFDLRF